ncbi:unnamed protein product [Brassica napus]|uniref:(rape) hypothetical protein n=1 Tax=Brassica napus TaxID=3708 RepID=A0A816UFR4_BRANA|nr:unnamed protein product [Brassica napus]
MVTRSVDLRSDTVTRPTDAMREAMASAEVDDDILGYDPTARHLEEEMAKMMGKEAALFVPSGTMGNLICVMVHCEMRGSELGAIEAAIRDPKGSTFYPSTMLICLENTHANSGGRCLSAEYTDSVGKIAKRHGLKLHIDGARLFNASIALGVPVHRLLTLCVSLKIFMDMEDGSRLTAEKLRKSLTECGILVLPGNSSRIRMVVHHQITISDVHYTLSCLQQAMQMIQEPSLNQTGKTENALSF